MLKSRLSLAGDVLGDLVYVPRKNRRRLHRHDQGFDRSSRWEMESAGRSGPSGGLVEVEARKVPTISEPTADHRERVYNSQGNYRPALWDESVKPGTRL